MSALENGRRLDTNKTRTRLIVLILDLLCILGTSIDGVGRLIVLFCRFARQITDRVRRDSDTREHAFDYSTLSSYLKKMLHGQFFGLRIVALSDLQEGQQYLGGSPQETVPVSVPMHTTGGNYPDIFYK